MTFKDPPLRVSPLIKFSRWTLLILGTFYGYKRNEYLTHREIQIREQERIQREARDVILRAEKARIEAMEMAMLEEIFRGTPSEDDDDEEDED